MELIRTDEERKEVEYIIKANVDIEVSEGDDNCRNDFEIEFNRYDWKEDITYGCIVFSPNTEYGGIVRKIKTNTSVSTITICGNTWRGMLARKVIQPDSGQDFATANGEINEIIKKMVETEFPGLFYGTNVSTGIMVHYQFARYCTMSEGLAEMLKSVGYKLNIKYKQGEQREAGYVLVESTPIINYSDEVELSQDVDMNFTMTSDYGGVNHLICLGKGELKNRIVIHLYVDQNGNIGETKYYTGIDEIIEVYDSSGSEYDDLRENGIKKLTEIKNETEYNMTIGSLKSNIDIGDIVGGRDYITGTSMKKPIGRKIWSINEGKETIEYKLEG